MRTRTFDYGDGVVNKVVYDEDDLVISSEWNKSGNDNEGEIELEKTYKTFLSRTKKLVGNLYTDEIGKEFMAEFSMLIEKQLLQAYKKAWKEEGDGSKRMPEYLITSYNDMLLNQQNFIKQYFKDISKAGKKDTGIDPLLFRTELWANRYNEAYHEALFLITLNNDGNMIWQIGKTEEHCPTCSGLNNIVLSAKDWGVLNVRPQYAPNKELACGGWKCDCSLLPTKKRKTKDGYGMVEQIVLETSKTKKSEDG